MGIGAARSTMEVVRSSLELCKGFDLSLILVDSLLVERVNFLEPGGVEGLEAEASSSLMGFVLRGEVDATREGLALVRVVGLRSGIVLVEELVVEEDFNLRSLLSVGFSGPLTADADLRFVEAETEVLAGAEEKE